MQQEWDDIDKIILDSYKDISLGKDYNNSIMSKVYSDKGNYQSHTAAISLIVAGFLLMFAYTGDLEYRLVDFKYKVKSEIFTLQNNFLVEKNILGE